MSNRRLFREEAIDFQRLHQQWGQVALLQPPSTKLLTWLLTGAIAAIFGFLWTAQYARKETVSGYVAPTAGTARIFAPQRGYVKQVHVRDGDEVSDGDALLTVSTDQVAMGGEDINASILQTLGFQQDLITKQIAAEERRSTSERERLSALVRGIETEISHLEAQKKIQADRLKLAENFVSSAVQLMGGYGRPGAQTP